jgi:hypothetical protein
VRSRASSFKWEYPLLFIRSSSSILRLLPRLFVTSISPFIFPSITCFRRQFLHINTKNCQANFGSLLGLNCYSLLALNYPVSNLQEVCIWTRCACLTLFQLTCRLSLASRLTCRWGFFKLTLYKLTIRPILTYAGPVWSNTSQSNYRHLQILQSKCLRVIGDYPRRTPIPYLHSTFSLEFIHTFIYRLTEKFFQNYTTHSNPLISQIGNYSLPDLAQYTKYTHKRTKHLLLQILPDNRSVFYIAFIFHFMYLITLTWTKIQEVLL